MRTGQDPDPKVLVVMELLVLFLVFALLAAASGAGFTADSRDGADWSPSAGGHRVPRRL